MTRPPAIKQRISSGGVIFRSRPNLSVNPGDNIEVAIVAVRGSKMWCLPKGMINKGEDPPAAALREVREETGLSGKIVEKIGQISYWYFLREDMVRIHKTVHFYLMQYVEGSTDDHDHEVEEARWFLIDDALKKLSYKSEREILYKAKELMERMH